MTDQSVAEDLPTPVTGLAWPVVAEQELRDLWLSGKGVAMMLAYTVLLSVSTYLVASNQELNFLEQREAVSLTLVMAGMVVRCGTTMEAMENASCNCPREHLTFIAEIPRRWFELRYPHPSILEPHDYSKFAL